MKELDFKHYFKVVGGKFVFEDKEMFKFIRQRLEGKRGFAVINEITEDISPNQYAYYFAGIIRRECMSSECFAGWKEGEIHNHLLRELEGTVRYVRDRSGAVKLIETVPDFSLFGKKRMTMYIEKLIPHLQTEYDIHPKPAQHYKYNKFYIKPETFKNEDLERDP